jgi:hypothetical protein
MTNEALNALLSRKSEIETALSRMEVWLLVFGVIVVVGVAGESIFGVRSWWINRKLHPIQQAIDQLRETDLANAKENAETARKGAEQERIARLKLEERLSPRSLNGEQSATLTASLIGFRGQKVEITENGLSREASSFSRQIQAALVAAKWDVKVAGVMGGVEQESGVLILIAKGQTHLPAASALAQALTSQGFAVKFAYDGGFTPDPLAIGVIRLFVGSKP